MIHAGLTVKYLGRSLLLKRGGNDSFMDKGLVYRDPGLPNVINRALYRVVPVPAYMLARRIYGRITRKPRIFE